MQLPLDVELLVKEYYGERSDRVVRAHNDHSLMWDRIPFPWSYHIAPRSIGVCSVRIAYEMQYSPFYRYYYDMHLGGYYRAMNWPLLYAIHLPFFDNPRWRYTLCDERPHMRAASRSALAVSGVVTA